MSQHFNYDLKKINTNIIANALCDAMSAPTTGPCVSVIAAYGKSHWDPKQYPFPSDGVVVPFGIKDAINSQENHYSGGNSH